MIDFVLSAFHVLLVFTLVAILAAQNALIRPGITASSLRLAATLDRVYRVSAGYYWGDLLRCERFTILSIKSPLLDQDRSLYDRITTLGSADRATDPVE